MLDWACGEWFARPAEAVRSDLARGPLLFQLPQLDAPDLPAPRLRQLADELDLTRVLVRRGHALAVLLELCDERLVSRASRPQDDECLDDLAAVGVRLADHGALGDGGVLQQRALHLNGPIR